MSSRIGAASANNNFFLLTVSLVEKIVVVVAVWATICLYSLIQFDIVTQKQTYTRLLDFTVPSNIFTMDKPFIIFVQGREEYTAHTQVSGVHGRHDFY